MGNEAGVVALSRDSATIPFTQFEGLLTYMQELGAGRSALLRAAGVEPSVYALYRQQGRVPMWVHCQLYRAAAAEMERSGTAMPWVGGVAGDAFEMMCHCMITCDSLGHALDRAQRFQALLARCADGIEVQRDGERANLYYRWFASAEQHAFIPEQALDPGYYRMLAQVSGLILWRNLCGWLIGRSIEIDSVRLATPARDRHSHGQLRRRFECAEIDYGAHCSSLSFSVQYLDCRLVHSAASLERFLRTAPYELMRLSHRNKSTSSAIRSLIGNDFSAGCPSFEQVAQQLNMSVSSLRRRLLKEKTSYQEVKNEVRRDAAMEYLRNPALSVREVAELTGFTEPGSFSRSFRQWMGLSPQAYRERLARGAEVASGR